jgi:hypothetical protein
MLSPFCVLHVQTQLVEINTYLNKINTKFWAEKLKGIDHFENVYINGAIILK